MQIWKVSSLVVWQFQFSNMIFDPLQMGLTGENDTSDIENLIPRDARDSLRKKGNQVIEFENEIR